MNKTLQMVIGFLLVGTGFLSIILSMIGVQLIFLAWMEPTLGPLTSFLIRLGMILAGFIFLVVSQTNFNEEGE